MPMRKTSSVGALIWNGLKLTGRMAYFLTRLLWRWKAQEWRWVIKRRRAVRQLRNELARKGVPPDLIAKITADYQRTPSLLRDGWRIFAAFRRR